MISSMGALFKPGPFQKRWRIVVLIKWLKISYKYFRNPSKSVNPDNLLLVCYDRKSYVNGSHPFGLSVKPFGKIGSHKKGFAVVACGFIHLYT
uniref:Uncharacterized protein n=1 Tax=Romanomermis culicivorax TaxID=13658 RepID=A0A915K5F0_ROMCU